MVLFVSFWAKNSPGHLLKFIKFSGHFVRFFKFITIFYAFLLALSAGMALCIGIFVAPVIFSQDLGSGAIFMREILIRANFLLVFLAIFAIFHEFLVIFWRRHSILRTIFTAITIALIVLFAFFFTPKISELQNQNLTATPEFFALHSQSTVVFKAIFFCTIALFFWNLANLFRCMR